MKVLIIEDEPHAQYELQRLLTESNRDIEVLSCIDSVEDAVDYINTTPGIDLMFFDIQLSDGLSFEIFNHIEVKAPIVFTTAYDEYAIRAFKVNSIDYLLKPVKQEDLNAALEKYDSLHTQQKPENSVFQMEQIQQLLTLNQNKYKSRFLTRMGEQIKYIDIEDVAYFVAEDNEVLLVNKEGHRYFINHSLDHLSSLLNPDSFYRINRSYYVQLWAIKKISKYFNSRLLIELEPKTEDQVLISRAKVNDFLNWIDK
ncbi:MULTISPECIES: LytTR family DNA-binding domain-containing protein [unclassified Lentimicrobium]|uniref:LytR/AlgR family response regulator transcription factor n=1 Tax=unclassified Lentimicrobium TaxID=2677434 RepID=UPI001556A93F|nr:MULTISPECIES: LytTR family DNA-binding domain-containing protein [unclassified Lentimicrobium]NPD47660.1 response regulator transcription factor [Lentimicrobium sp. S6]NPD86614.1 response regulator transcription factor [Lentimicrobium sp. L6]